MAHSKGKPFEYLLDPGSRLCKCSLKIDWMLIKYVIAPALSSEQPPEQDDLH